ncbi:MAG: ABC transporter permease [Cyclobacteriaceae bacterium]
MNDTSHIAPPRWPLRILRFFLKKEYLEEIEGDMEEVFQESLEIYSIGKAKRRYAWEVLKLIRGSLIKKSVAITHSNTLIMFKNNFKIAYRSLIKSRGYTAINVLGLAIGIAFSCLLYSYVSHELSYDSFHTKAERIFRVVTVDLRNPTSPKNYGETMPPMAPAFVNEYPEAQEFTRLFKPFGQIILDSDGENFMERDWFIADSSFFSVFSYTLLHGNSLTALAEPNSIVLSKNAAIKYFGSAHNAMGKTLKYGETSIAVTGVLAPIPSNSHLQCDVLVSMFKDENFDEYLNKWDSFGAFTYIVTSAESDLAILNDRMPEFEKKYTDPGTDFFDLKLQPLKDIYMNSYEVEYGAETSHGNISYVYIFSTIGIFILILACVNYINLVTARAMNRAKEVGVRKSLGAHKLQLIAQFLTESFLVTFFAMILAIVVLHMVAPYFNQIAGSNLDLSLYNMVDYLPSMVALSASIAILSGIYPAFHLSLLKPLMAFRSASNRTGKSSMMRKSLVVFQFAITAIMIISTIVISRQLNYIQSKDMGFDQHQLLVIDINSRNVRAKFQSMKNELEMIPGVEHVGVSSRVPGEWKNITRTSLRASSNNRLDSIESFFMGFDEGMQEAYGFELTQGNYFEANSNNNAEKILLNESAVRSLGLDNPVGQTLEVAVANKETRYKAKVIGVFKDFHFQSLHKDIAPLTIGAWNNPVRVIDYFTLKVSGNVRNVIERAELVHGKFDMNSPMEYNLLDERLQDFYDQEKRASLLFKMGVILSIIVAALGLLGLSAFMAEQRRKEIGIRKVLGASLKMLIRLLTIDFLKPVIIALVVATPVAWFLMSGWLDGFAYRIRIDWWVFAGSGAVLLVIAILAVSWQTIRAAIQNPVDSLRS